MGTEKASAEGNYTLRFPFQLAPGQEVSGLEQPVEHELNNLVLRLEYRDPFYVFSVQGFGSEESAKGFVDHLWAGLMWVLLNAPNKTVRRVG